MRGVVCAVRVLCVVLCMVFRVLCAAYRVLCAVSKLCAVKCVLCVVHCVLCVVFCVLCCVACIVIVLYVLEPFRVFRGVYNLPGGGKQNAYHIS